MKQDEELSTLREEDEQDDRARHDDGEKCDSLGVPVWNESATYRGLTMTEIINDIDLSQFDEGDTLYVLDKDEAKYIETTVTSVEQAGYSTRLKVADSTRRFELSSHFDHKPGDWAHLATPETVVEVANAFANDTGTDVDIVEKADSTVEFGPHTSEEATNKETWSNHGDVRVLRDGNGHFVTWEKV